ncbi:hypothetical protein DWX81_07435 [Roseburia inulinivorans]|uniref:hypothetical protein n=1 Tax=Roseburia inulinivorans TaxID=360807 RepID=UPI000E523062|nr:hypothetical protein [Roseburia inulinivorans]RGS67281.1 hypothetical protein DWX81_07435 [Roseburia inulinivorans]
MMECMKSMAKKPQTNADRIRSMTDEELADFLVTVETYGYHDQSISGTYEMKEWLLMESEEWHGEINDK